MKTRSLYLLIPLLLGTLPETLSACPMCMGAQNGPTASAVNNAIFIMFGVLGLIFTGIGSLFFSLYRRAKNSSLDNAEFAIMKHGVREAGQHA